MKNLVLGFLLVLGLAFVPAASLADHHEAGENPCNPCAENPCAENPCNPCADNPCNPCNPCGEKQSCDEADAPGDY